MTNEQYIHRFNRFQKSRENFYAPKILAALNTQYKQAINHAHLGKISVHAIDATPIEKVLKTIYMDAAIIYGAKVRADFAKEPKVETKNRRAIGFSERMAQLVRDYFRTDILNTAQGITETTRKLIVDVFTNYYEQGLGIDDIVKQLENTDISRIRARLIARTETVTAANQGALFVAKETGLKVNKVWLATNDKRTRDDHREVNGQTIGRDDYFNVGGNTMLIPGARVQENGLPVEPKEFVNCRCSTLFRPLRDANGRLIREGSQETAVPQVQEINVELPKFVEAKTIKEAEDFAKNVVGVKYANFKGIDLQIANDINKSVFNIKQVMPKIRTNGIGSAQQANRDLKKKIIEAYKKGETYKNYLGLYGKERADKQATRFANKTTSNVGGNTIAWSQSKTTVFISGGERLDVSEFTGVFVSDKYGNNKIAMDKMIVKNEANGWFTKDAKDFGYIMSHEIGHEIDKTINFKNLSEFKVIYNREHSNGIESVISKLSRYGATAGGKASNKPDEMIAEAWAEFMTSKNPRPLAKEIGELMLKTYHTDYLQGTGVKFEQWKTEIMKIVQR